MAILRCSNLVALRGAEGKPALLDCTREVEQKILDDFLPLYAQWVEGALSDQAFFRLYDQAAKQWIKKYERKMPLPQRFRQEQR